MNPSTHEVYIDLLFAAMLALVFAEMMEFLGWLARYIVRLSARITFPDDPAEARDAAEEWIADRIETAPLKTIALCRAIGILGSALRVALDRPAQYVPQVFIEAARQSTAIFAGAVFIITLSPLLGFLFLMLLIRSGTRRSARWARQLLRRSRVRV